MILPQQK